MHVDVFDLSDGPGSSEIANVVVEVQIADKPGIAGYKILFAREAFGLLVDHGMSELAGNFGPNIFGLKMLVHVNFAPVGNLDVPGGA